MLTPQDHSALYADFEARVLARLRERADWCYAGRSVTHVCKKDLDIIFAAPPQAEQATPVVFAETRSAAQRLSEQAKPPEQPAVKPRYVVECAVNEAADRIWIIDTGRGVIAQSSALALGYVRELVDLANAGHRAERT